MHLSSGTGNSHSGVEAVSLDTRSLLTSIFQMSQKPLDHSDVAVLHQFKAHLQESPKAAQCVWEVGGAVPKLAELQDCGVLELEEEARVCLSLLGYAPPYSGRGLRILSMDGGGTRLVFLVTKNYIVPYIHGIITQYLSNSRGIGGWGWGGSQLVPPLKL